MWWSDDGRLDVRVMSFLVIGAGRFGAAVAETLFDRGHEVVVIDRDEGAIDGVMAHASHAVIVDGTDEGALRSLGVSNFDAVVVAIGDDTQASILATAAAKDAGARRIVSKAPTSLIERILRRVGADEIVRPDRDMGVRLADHLANPSLVDAFRLGDAFEVIEVKAGESLVGRLAKLRLPNRFGVHVMAVDRRGELTVAPSADFAIELGDRLVVVGSNASVEKLQAYLSE
jgi:trk system potassium uptake protein